MNKSASFFGKPCSSNSASGAAQFAQRSTKSQMGSPAIGRMSAVAKPQIVAQINTSRIGQNRANTATAISSPPINGINVVAVVDENPTAVKNGIQLCLMPSAKMPCPKNDPKMPMRSTHSAGEVACFAIDRPPFADSTSEQSLINLSESELLTVYDMFLCLIALLHRMKKGIVLILVLLVLVGCARETVIPAATPTKTTETTAAATPPVRSTTTPPPGASTTSAEMIGDTTDCVVKADCVSYVEKDGTPAELCAEYDEVGCYHHYACAPSGEVVQKETPAFCGR